jgi:hypothetical protein
VRKLVFAFLLAGLTLLASCGSGSGPLGAIGAPITITLSDQDAGSVFAGQSVPLTALVYDPAKKGVTWTVTPLNFGTLNQVTPFSATYTAPPLIPASLTITITATSITNPSITSVVKLSALPIVVGLGVFDSNLSINIPLADQTLTQGGQLLITANVANVLKPTGINWSLSPASGAGTLSTTAFAATYNAPSAVSSPTPVIVSAISKDSSTASATLTITVLPSGAGPNVVALSVDGGPVPARSRANGAFTSLTLCNPGTSSPCQTIDGILVDTGSSGLRILQSQLSPLLKLPTFTDALGNTLQNCDLFPDGSFLWGPVSQADLYIGGEAASQLIVPKGAPLSSAVNLQLVSSITAVPESCSNGSATNDNTALLLGANGILGVGVEPTDCTLAGANLCDGSVQATVPNLYYTCPAAGCGINDAPVSVPATQQVTNPVAKFLPPSGSVIPDSNGLIIQLPAVSEAQTAAIGTMTFGIGTEINNGLGSATVLTLNSNDNFNTIFNGQNLTASFINSGSDALFFPDSLPVCTDNKQFFCPTSSPTNLSAINEGTTQGETTVNFSVDNADSLFANHPDDAVFSGLAGPNGKGACSDGKGACTFEWGLPFFFGRSVYTHIDGCGPPPASCDPLTAAWWAY